MHHSLTQEQKVTILLAALAERYNAQHIIRGRAQGIGLWALGLLFAAGGWLIQSGIQLHSNQKTFFIIGILMAFIALRFKYIADLEKGFKSQQERAVRIEKTLGLFTPGTFDGNNEAIYPTHWEKIGTDKKAGGKFFHTTNLLLYIGVVFLILAILSSGSGHHTDHLIYHF